MPIIRTKNYTLVTANKSRSYRLHLPTGYNPNKRYAVVIALHGYGSNGFLMEVITGFSQLADKEKFIVVYPNGTKSKMYPRLSWNGGSCCGNGIVSNVDDVDFIKQLISKLEKDYSINNKKVYVTGFSNGAIMTYRLITELPGTFAAAGVGSGSIAGKTLTDYYHIPEVKRPIPLIIFHGTKDTSIPYNGGKNLKGDGTFSSVKESVQFWKENNKNQADVILFTIEGGAHVWFHGLDELYYTHKLSSTSATLLIWDFFKKH